MNKLQIHIDSLSVTDPQPERRISRQTIQEVDSIVRRRKARRGFWRLLRALLPLFLLAAAASAETIVTDYWGNVLFRLPWPSDETLYVKTPVNATLPGLAPRPSPTPKPISTPRPVLTAPNSTPAPGSGADTNRYYSN